MSEAQSDIGGGKDRLTTSHKRRERTNPLYQTSDIFKRETVNLLIPIRASRELHGLRTRLGTQVSSHLHKT